MELDHIIADPIDALCGFGKFAKAALDVAFGHRMRDRPAVIVRNGGGRLGGPATFFLRHDRLSARRGGGRPGPSAGVGGAPTKTFGALFSARNLHTLL